VISSGTDGLAAAVDQVRTDAQALKETVSADLEPDVEALRTAIDDAKSTLSNIDSVFVPPRNAGTLWSPGSTMHISRELSASRPRLSVLGQSPDRIATKKSAHLKSMMGGAR
jgi:hypothetical protein